MTHFKEEGTPLSLSSLHIFNFTLNLLLKLKYKHTNNQIKLFLRIERKRGRERTNEKWGENVIKLHTVSNNENLLNKDKHH
jgi:7,8-dihydro-6-hydroxymethylpterin-pyrophosphokinase